MKDLRTFLLLIVCLCLVGTWAYHIYDKNQYSANTQIKQDPYYDSNQVASNDSIRMRYLIAVSDLDDVRVGNDSLNTELNEKITEIDSLRNEVSAILAINNITKEDLHKAEEKINQLQKKVQQANRKDTPADNEVKKPQTSKGNSVAEAPVRSEGRGASAMKEYTAPVLLNVTGISFKAMKYEDSEQSTTKANDAGNFLITCQLQNNTASINDAEVYISLTDPRGVVIQDDQWQAGMFLTRANTRIPYSRKNSFSYVKGDSKRIAVSIKPSEIIQGTYSLQIYHNGIRIGKTDLRLN